MDAKHLVVFITVPSAEVGRNIADSLVEQGLAACVNILSPMHSIYMWEGNKQSEEETLLIVKTTVGVFSEKLVPAVQRIHPYEVPEIIALPIVYGSGDYLDWIDENTQAGSQ